jgi:cytochrome c peroxidase
VLGRASSLVWASSDYQRTGIEPYVHRRGARVPSLRRLYKKRPYFTDGSAPSLEDLLRGARFSKSGAFYHRAANDPELSAFTDAEVRTLKSFVDLL